MGRIRSRHGCRAGGPLAYWPAGDHEAPPSPQMSPEAAAPVPVAAMAAARAGGVIAAGCAKARGCGVKMPSSREFDVWAAASAPQCVTRAGTFLCDSFGHGFTLTHSPNTEAERATIDTAHTHVTPRCRTVTVTLSDDYADGLYRVLSVVVVVFASQHPIKSPLFVSRAAFSRCRCRPNSNSTRGSQRVLLVPGRR